MIYRVILKNSYYELWFDFDSIAEAGNFAKTVLIKQVGNEDNKKKTFITIHVINPEPEEENKEDEE